MHQLENLQKARRAAITGVLSSVALLRILKCKLIFNRANDDDGKHAPCSDKLCSGMPCLGRFRTHSESDSRMPQGAGGAAFEAVRDKPTRF